jgi:hypothetical protein
MVSANQLTSHSYFTARHYTPLPLTVFDDNKVSQPNILSLAHHLAVNHDEAIPAESIELLKNRALPVPSHGPSDRLAAVDMVYHFLERPSKIGLLSEWSEGLGTWATVGKHMRFQPGVVKLAESYLRMVFGLSEGASIPPVCPP